MWNIRKIISAILLCLSFALLQGCDDNPVIGRKDMSSIIAKMYLADQYVSETPSLMVQCDTMLLYQGIMADYGYTLNDYISSIEIYLKDADSYQKILKDAYNILDVREKELEQTINAMLDQERRARIEQWWAVDSLRSVAREELVYDRFLRGFKWLVLPDERLDTWTILDSAIVDIPQNPQWWANTLVMPERSYSTFMVRKTEENNNEKDSRKLRIPAKRISNPERIR